MTGSAILLILTIMGAQAAKVPPPAGNAENGKKIFASHGCYQCHNYLAQGGMAGPRLAPQPMAWPVFSAYVRQPRADMPPYTVKVLTGQELADIYAFLLTIPAPPPIDSIPILKAPPAR